MDSVLLWNLVNWKYPVRCFRNKKNYCLKVEENAGSGKNIPIQFTIFVMAFTKLITGQLISWAIQFLLFPLVKTIFSRRNLQKDEALCFYLIYQGSIQMQPQNDKVFRLFLWKNWQICFTEAITQQIAIKYCTSEWL